jgi:hypothetical protein
MRIAGRFRKAIVFFLLVPAMLAWPWLSPSKRDDVVEETKKYIGTPYVMGGMAPGGFDCSGLLWYVFKQHGQTIPRGSFSQFAELPGARSLKPGDFVFFQTVSSGASHVGLYVGENRFLHAPSTGKTVSYADLDSDYWKTRYLGARSVFTDGALIAYHELLRVSARVSLSILEFTGSPNPTGIGGLFALSAGLVLDIPYERSWVISVQALLDMAIYGDDDRNWVPFAVRLPVLGKYYLSSSTTFGWNLQGGGALAFGLGEPGDERAAFASGNLDLILGMGFDIEGYTFDIHYEYSVLSTIDGPTASGRTGRWVFGAQLGF